MLGIIAGSYALLRAIDSIFLDQIRLRLDDYCGLAGKRPQSRFASTMTRAAPATPHATKRVTPRRPIALNSDADEGCRQPGERKETLLSRHKTHSRCYRSCYSSTITEHSVIFFRAISQGLPNGRDIPEPRYSGRRSP